MVIRPAEPQDHADWLRLRRALWPECSEAMHTCEMEHYAKDADNRAVFVLVREDGSLGGFVEVSVRDRVDGSMTPRVAYLEGWFVEADLRRHGFGRSLVAAAERWGSARGLSEMASDAELDNEQGRGAHQALGFRETFRLVHFLKSLQALVALLTLLGLTSGANAAPVNELKILSFNIWPLQVESTTLRHSSTGVSRRRAGFRFAVTMHEIEATRGQARHPDDA
jgi:aminoglycoside 6'-N-acetyltransferase I